jgi:hypothetical protein
VIPLAKFFFFFSASELIFISDRDDRLLILTFSPPLSPLYTRQPLVSISVLFFSILLYYDEFITPFPGLYDHAETIRIGSIAVEHYSFSFVHASTFLSDPHSSSVDLCE